MPPSAALRPVEETQRRRVVALIRVSTAEQAHEDRGGIPRQRRVIEQTIAEKDLDCLKIYQISDVSGADVRKNPEVQEVLQLVATKVVTGLVVADLDRLFREKLSAEARLNARRFFGCRLLRPRHYSDQTT